MFGFSNTEINTGKISSRMFDLVVDAKGLRCPLPVLRLNHRMKKLEPGVRIRLVCDDVSALTDVPLFCKSNGHRFDGVKKETKKPPEQGTVFYFAITKGNKDHRV